MRRSLIALAVLLGAAAAADARGLLIPADKTVPPLAMLNHKVEVRIEDQVAQTRVEQTFRNHTARNLEATYVFPVPKGASVDKFTMWVNGKETKGELIEAKRARQIYTSIVRRTQDPGLLEYLGQDLLQMRVFPVPPNGDQKVAVRFTAVAPREARLVEYVYPLKTDGKAVRTLEAFSLTATIKSSHGVQNVYSPTHSISLKRVDDKEVKVSFDKDQALLDKDFQLFYSLGKKDVGLTALTHKPLSGEDGFFALLVTPRVNIDKKYMVPRDVVLVLDTSGSMQRDGKIDQAKKALKHCLKSLSSRDRFALVNFATAVDNYDDKLQEASPERIERAVKWVEELTATGGTAINDALARALDFRTKDEGRSFTVIFFTDGQPTIGETDPEKILKNTAAKNTANTRIFTFGVGDDVNASMLDRLAETTRALSTYVRPAEDIEAKTSGLVSKISHPILTDLKLSATLDVKLYEVYPTKLPDLFHGGELVVFGRYKGKGASAIRLTGRVGKEEREFAYDLTFPEKTGDERAFVEQLWARRKVGYMLDQIRVNGEKTELVNEVVALAKKYGITTPYTSYLIVPDGPLPVVRRPIKGPPPPGFGMMGGGGFAPRGLLPGGPAGKPMPVEEFAKAMQKKRGDLARNRLGLERETYRRLAKDPKSGKADGKVARDTEDKLSTYLKAKEALGAGRKGEVQAGKLGVDLSVQMQNLRNQSRLDRSALRLVNGRNCLELGGVWIDEGFEAKTPTLAIKAQSDAYFKILERQPKMRTVFLLGNHLVWITPSGTALIIDTTKDKTKLADGDIDKLFVARR